MFSAVFAVVFVSLLSIGSTAPGYDDYRNDYRSDYRASRYNNGYGYDQPMYGRDVKAPFSSQLANQLGIGLAPRVEGTRRALTVAPGVSPWSGISLNDVRQDKSQIAINSVGTSLSNGRGIFANQLAFSPFFKPTAFPSTFVAQDQFVNSSPFLMNSDNQQQNSQLINAGSGFFINQPQGSQFQNQFNRAISPEAVFIPSLGPSASPFGPSFDSFGQMGQVNQFLNPWSFGSQVGQVNQFSPFLTPSQWAQINQFGGNGNQWAQINQVQNPFNPFQVPITAALVKK